MPNEYSNFTQQDADRPDQGYSTGTPGTGDHGEVWDPVTKTWSKPGQRSNDAAKNGYWASGYMGSGRDNSAARIGGPQTAGRVSGIDPSWGGYSSTVVYDANGNLVNDPSQSGRAADVGKYRNLAQAAANRQAYQNDYTAANGYAAQAQQARGIQGDAMGMARNAALGGPTASQQLARNMLSQGLAAQQSAALSARGGPLAQAAALRQQQMGQGGFIAQGNQQLAALQAQEMADARSQYAQYATQQRNGDMTGAELNQQQANAQMQNELAQRGLNQQAQTGYEGLAYDVNAASQQAALDNRKIDVGAYDVNSQFDQRDADRRQQVTGAALSAVGTGLSAAAGAFGNSDQKKSGGDNWWDHLDGSDRRMKTEVRSMGLAGAAMARRGGR
ncbi:hypothetical protein AKJ09_03664 [Labilithrix luteola]|uniref:Uncharacterized protein n=1 Tax=Labilithrix luteola TaxID=1391654 RepID=A0A0K1PTY9_9BACT|nr:hypothetical protein [Labilithrix luteola]AKU97000.1 hypothetical protein AKJ09_03664 [Labilithrix luteola]